MASCEIGLMMNDGSIWAVRCQFNGYVKNGVGQLLYENYDKVDVLSLFQKGNIAVLTDSPATTSYQPWGHIEYASPMEWFDSHRFGPENVSQFIFLAGQKDTTKFYKDEFDYAENWEGKDYKYLLRNKDKKEWEVMDINGNGLWYSVGEVLEEEV